MTKTKLLFIIFFLGIITIGFSQNISKKNAQTFAKNFFYERANQYSHRDYQQLEITKSVEEKINSKAVFYVFNFKNGGWIITSSDFRIKPILAYSFDGFYQTKNQSPSFISWMKKYKQQILGIIESSNQAFDFSDNINEWNYYLKVDINDINIKKAKSIQPLLKTKWNQGMYYNEACPEDVNGVGGHAYAGCVPTAMGQVANYYRWPEQGTSSYSYLDSTYGQLSADFANTTYRWNEMPLSLNKSNSAIAELLFHLGVSCDLRYGPNGSGMYNHKTAYSLKTFFKYLPTTEYLFKDSTSINWIDTIKWHLDNKMPMYYAGWTADSLIGTSGHAFVLDGYQDTNYFHFNWGWGGYNDGYFYLNDLTPGSSIFNYGQEVVLNCFPDTINYIYPYYCSASSTLNSIDGTIDDGSGPVYDYQNNSSCLWLIAPQDSVLNIKLEFLNFETENVKDFVKVYDGALTTSPLLGSFSGNSLPPIITSTGDRMLVEFVSDSVNVLPGFIATYKSTLAVFCSGTTYLTAPSGTFEDGSGSNNYHTTNTCRWKIEPPNAVTATISFNYFDVHSTDYLRIIDNHTGQILGEFSGDSLPPSVTSYNGKLQVFFRSNFVKTAGGWEASYTSSLTGIKETNELENFQIYPNPTNDYLNISFLSKKKQEFKIDIIDVTGSTCYCKNRTCSAGVNRHNLDVSSLNQGIYMLKISGDDFVVCRKIAVK